MNQLAVFALSFIAGIALRSFFDLGFVFIFFLALLAATLFFWGVWSRQSRVFLVSLSIIFVSFGMFRFELADAGMNDPILETFAGRHISVEGFVSDEPDERDLHTNIVVNLEYARNGEELVSVNGRMIASVERFPEWKYGDRVLLSGEIRKPENFADEDTGRIFNYIGFLGKDGIAYQMFYPEVELVGVGDGSFIKEKLFAFKHALLDRVGRVLPEPHASLLAGIVLGAKQSLGTELLDDFRTTGIIHIVVLSGYNVTIVAESIMRFFAFLPFAASLLFGAGSIVLFAIMTGAGATVVRASTMALLVVLARATGRVYEIKRALFIAGFLMVMQNPKILVFDVSFQLSFVATIGLIYAAPIVEKHILFLTDRLGLRKIAAATIATQIFVLPLLLYHVGTLSLAALPVNLLVLFVVPAVMFFGFLAGMLGFVHFVPSMAVGVAAYILLEYILLIVTFFAQIPLASVSVAYFPAVAVAIAYLILWWWIRRTQISEKSIVSIDKNGLL